MKMLQMENPGITESLSGGISQSLLGPCCCQGQRQDQHPHTSLLPTWGMALLLHFIMSSPKEFSGEREEIRPLNSSTRLQNPQQYQWVLLPAVWRHQAVTHLPQHFFGVTESPPAPLLWPKDPDLPQLLSAAGPSCTSQNSPSLQPLTCFSFNSTGLKVGCGVLDKTSNTLRKQRSYLHTPLNEICLRICIILRF